MSNWMDQLNALGKQLDTLDSDMDVDEEEEEADERGNETILKDTLFQVCEVVRNAASEDARDLRQIVDRAQEIVNAGMGHAYGSETSEGLFDFLPSFAHGSDAALVEDPAGKNFGTYIAHCYAVSLTDLCRPWRHRQLRQDLQELLQSCRCVSHCSVTQVQAQSPDKL